MTIATGRVRELDIAKICQRAYQLTGLANESQNISFDKQSFAKDIIESILDDLEADGLRARAIAFETLALVAGQSAYSLNADVIDVVGQIMYIPPGTVDLDHAGGEIPLISVTREDWQLQVAKDATGRPLQYYAHRAASPVELRLWPTPTASDLGTLRMQVHRLAADSNDGAKTVDLERYWSLYLIWELAHHLAMANSLNMGRVQYFEGIALKHLEKCKSYSAQKTQSRFVASHSTGWNRR
jgi:hypothetical protein